MLKNKPLSGKFKGYNHLYFYNGNEDHKEIKKFLENMDVDFKTFYKCLFLQIIKRFNIIQIKISLTL